MKRKKINKHKFNLGGLANTTGWNQIPLTGPSATPLNLGQTLKTSLGEVGNMLGGLADVGVTAFNSIINPSGNSTKVGNFLSATGSTISKVPGLNFIGAGVNALGGLWNAAFGSNLNEDFINQTESNIEAQNNYVSNATNTTQWMNDWLSHKDLNLVNQDDVGSDGWFSDDAKDKTNELNQKTIAANNRAKVSLRNTGNNIQTNQLLTALSNYRANGGPIHIKKANRGKFTKYCGGEVTSECIERGKRSSDPAVRKRATFAANARKWKHAFGGDLLTNGIEWSNGLKTINNGGTHEENPFEGVQMGIAPDGLPNLVEEGEVIFNDYVFSNRMTANKDLLDKFKLPKSYDGYSFAAIAEKLSKESKERPNDPISKRGLMSSMTRLQQAQETMRQKSQVGQEGKEYAHGGKMGILFDGLGDYPNSLGDWQDFGVLDTPITVDELESMMSKTSNPVNKNRGTNKLTYLRYAPILGSAIGLGYNLFKKPDYSGPDAILEAAEQVGNYTPIDYTPIGNYLTYKPLDRDYYTNKLNAQSGATRRAILNTTSPSRNAALLAADYNAQTKLGDLFRQAEEYNLAQRERVEGFNRQTNMANSEMGLKASMANQEAALKAKSQRLSGVAQAMAMRDTIDSRRGASISANLTNLFDSLGSVGKEEFIKDMIENNPLLLYNWMGIYKDKKNSKGGYLTIKKRGK